MNIKEMREKSISDLYKDLNNLKKDYNLIKLKIASKQSNEFDKKNNLKKDIARVQTIISEKKVLKHTE